MIKYATIDADDVLTLLLLIVISALFLLVKLSRAVPKLTNKSLLDHLVRSIFAVCSTTTNRKY